MKRTQVETDALSSIFGDDALSVTIDKSTMEKIEYVTQDLYIEMKKMPQKRGKVQKETLEQSEIDKIRSMDIIDLLPEIEIEMNEKMERLDELMANPDPKLHQRWRATTTIVKKKEGERRQGLKAERIRKAEEDARINQKLKEERRGMNNKPPAKPLVVRSQAKKVAKLVEKKKVLQEWEQNFIDYDIGDMIEFVKDFSAEY